MKKLNIKGAPNALLSRECLKDLSPVKERWEGKTTHTLIYAIIGMALLASSVLIFAELKLPIIFSSAALLWFPITLFMIGYEQVLILQKNKQIFITYITDYLNEGEIFLTILSGRALAFNTPDWLPDDFFHRSYFIFTSDRILIITFKASKIKNGSILDSLDIGLKDIISGIYCCDYIDDKSCVFGGIISNIIVNISHTKIKIRAIGEKEIYSWALENKGTRNGHLLKEIITRLNSRDRRYF